MTDDAWLGEVQRLSLIEAEEDTDGPVLEIIGDNSVAAMEFTDEDFVEALTELSTVMQLEFDKREDR